ncbi:haloacid dehalogenase superfamily, subfamily IA, variant 1 with third motif having Dx(3-4)D or Dx(3-4)E [Halorubrum xinjiangense]|uniref:Haloacid dehalogenase superfamily, subfamily IA, variant 1 with third motif having Dx(3-4)D or Dx(3-4)E n=1 Tax=Halorubrum xinjiangense TaxID=261291 RepID=A0A1G7MMX8_9EURY|nr:HAD family hydrolase [Halorubrum xinjiangense]SDF63014.1 haloacid dehalogenase superfamily, subfamily IA, variant 1 with third motif having Dx(3-4)D or Dx(3-4)E [Halorubrum xinjiangense]
MTGYDAVLFDNDGVLVEPPTHETAVEATREAFDEVGVRDPSQAHVDDIVHGTTVERLREMCTAYGVDVETFWRARERLDEQSQFEKFESGSRTLYDDVRSITNLEQPRGVVSNNHHSTVEFVLDFFDLRQAFDTYHGREKTVESLDLKKPNTHYLDRAVAELGAESVLYVGDSESDVRAAHRAGLDSAFVRRPHCRETNPSVTPTHEIESLRNLVAITDA